MAERFPIRIFIIVIFTFVLWVDIISSVSIEDRGVRQQSRANTRTRPTADLMNGLWARIGKRYKTSKNLTNTEFKPILRPFVKELKLKKSNEHSESLKSLKMKK